MPGHAGPSQGGVWSYAELRLAVLHQGRARGGVRASPEIWSARSPLPLAIEGITIYRRPSPCVIEQVPGRLAEREIAMASNAELENVCLPINLDAFVLNEAVCDKGLTRIAPITQPNYVSLRLDNSQIQHDILPRIDLHDSQPAIVNGRISTTYSGDFRDLDARNPSPDPATLSGINRSRLGIYLHWTIPRAYRSGSSQAAPAPAKPDSSKATAPTTTASPNPDVPASAQQMAAGQDPAQLESVDGQAGGGSRLDHRIGQAP